jgi:hypothetical protein
MPIIFAYDIGTNSLGWAVVDLENKKILGSGSEIFPEGINRDTKGAEISKNQTRRMKRQTRRQFFRRRLRKFRLATILFNHGMFPDFIALHDQFYPDKVKDHNREKFKRILQQVRQPEELKRFFALNPYDLRSKAAQGEKLSKMELGRVLYQLAQRRGYKENLQTPLEDGKAIMKGDPSEEKVGIEATRAALEENKTLGQYLSSLDTTQERIRNRYTLRSWYLHEFNVIWESQKDYYPDFLTNELKKQIGDEQEGELFYQRPLVNQKHLLGTCTFEPNKPKCPKSSPLFELRRMYEFINNIRLEGRRLNEEQKNIIIDLFNSKDRFTFEEIQKKLCLTNGNFNYEKELKIAGNKTLAGLSKVFGKKAWNDMSWEQKMHAWHIKLNGKDRDKTIEYVKNKWGFDDKQADKFIKLRLADGYGQLSTRAINRILPYLKRGEGYSDAVLLAGLSKAFGNTVWNNYSDEYKKEIEDNVLSVFMKDDEGTGMDHAKDLLREAYGLNDHQLDKLYHHSDIDGNPHLGYLPEDDKKIKKIKNPVVEAALFEVRRMTNALIEKYGKPNEIKIEMARELKMGAKKREEFRFKQREREKENIEAKKTLDEYGMPYTRRNVQKVLLFRELEKVSGKAISPFSGKTISISQLFNEGYFQIEHIIPYSVSLDDSMANKTLCEADINREKGDDTPYEYYKRIGGDWDDIKNRIFKILPYKKAKRFISKDNPALEQFISRQLNDTRYISRFARDYLKMACQNVSVTQGSVTETLRRHWGLDGILNAPQKLEGYPDGEYIVAVDVDGKLIEGSLEPWVPQPEQIKKIETDKQKIGKPAHGYVRNNAFYLKKLRNDHRHHAIDALAVACSNQGFLQKLATMSGKGQDRNAALNFPEPWEGFYQDAKKSIEGILVTYHQKDRVLTKVKKALFDKKSGKRLEKKGKKLYGQGIAARGALHEETYYGKRNSPDNGEEGYHIRKGLDQLTPKMVNQIVDPTVRKAVKEALLKADPTIDFTKKFNIPKNAFFEMDDNGKRIPKVHIPNRNGDPIPVKKVRIRKTASNMVQLSEVNKWVEPGSNHHVLLFDLPDGKRIGKMVTFWDAVEAEKQGLETIDRHHEEGAKFYTWLKKGDMVLLNVEEDIDVDSLSNKEIGDHLYYLRKTGQSQYGIMLVRYTVQQMLMLIRTITQ